MKYVKLLFIFMIIALIAITITSTAYGWFLGQNIYQTTYSAKAGVNFWDTWTLEGNIFTASLLLTLLSVITLPQRSTFISFMSAISQSGPVTKRLDITSAVIWRLLEFGGFFVFYVSTGGYSLTGQNVAFLMMLMGHGSISITSAEVTTLFSLPFAPGTSSESILSLVPALEAYQLYLGLFATFLVLTGVRLALSAITDMMSHKRDMFVVIPKFLIVISIAISLEILGVPMWTVNAGTWMSYMALIVAFFASIAGAVLFLFLRVHMGDAQQRTRSKIAQLEEDFVRFQGELVSLRKEYESGEVNPVDYRRRVTLLMEDRSHIAQELGRLKLERLIPIRGSPRKFGFLAAILIAMVIILPLTQGFYYGIQMEGDKYIDWEFNYETHKEITITNWAAGLDDMEMKTLDDLTLNATPEGEVEFLTTVRQWDQAASFLRMKNQIGTNWMELADSDIVLLRGHEYWIAPLTFDYSATRTSFINQHLIYTHSEGLVVLDAYSGDIIEQDSLVALLNRSESIDIYYGEGPGFGDVVFTDVSGFEEINNATFQGAPDYNLAGLESTFYMLAMGPDAWSFMGRNMSMLVQRDVLSRVRTILLQGLVADRDPYIVVDTAGNLHYAVSIYIDYSLATGYAAENYMRFLGVVLVDIGTGELEFFKSPTAEESFFIDRTYMNYYDWQEAPNWLQSQMKWPEDLYERQLDVAYIYHVDDGFVWQAGQDFHEAPDNSDTRYIIMRIGGEDRFVAMHNSEFRDSVGRNLAGIYVMGCGDTDFGRLTFYSAGEPGFSTLLGPTAAVQAFETNDEVRTQLQLWGKHRYGNRLLYHLGGDLFFVIPVFLEVESSSNIVIEKLGGVGLVDAESGERVELGSSVVEAYYKMFGLLNQTAVEAGAVGIESAIFDPLTIDSGAFSQLVLGLRNNDNVSHDLWVDIVIVAGNFSVSWHGSEVTPTVYPSNTTFTLSIGTVGAGDIYGTSPLVAVYLPTGLVLGQYLVYVILRTEEGVADQVSLILTVT
ncbi:MAG: UPF0182 family protein [Candidatus Thorarchaeota archaeon]